MLRGMKQHSARFLLGDTVGLCRRRWQPTTLAFQRSCVLRGFAASAFLCHQFDFKFAAKRRKPQKVGHFPFQPHAVALLRLSSTVNTIRLVPRPLATINNAETRDLGFCEYSPACFVTGKMPRRVSNGNSRYGLRQIYPRKSLTQGRASAA